MSWRRLHKKFSTSLREHTTNVISFEKNKMLLTTKESHQKITLRFKYMLHLLKNNLKKGL